ncbi:MAG TPA: helix-turn-helix transcriptional regulator [Terriglobia bacterium]|nr:helix-turn-helix transcriptional regulator [Terriglobia bacterium]
MASTFGSYFKELRTRKGWSLRRFCETNGYDPGNISRLERGVFPSPESPQKLREYAKALGLKDGGEEWIEFFDRAAAARGQLPADLQADEKLIGRLPILFRTLRGRKVTPEKLDQLAEMIRRGHSD